MSRYRDFAESQAESKDWIPSWSVDRFTEHLRDKGSRSFVHSDLKEQIGTWEDEREEQEEQSTDISLDDWAHGDWGSDSGGNGGGSGNGNDGGSRSTLLIVGVAAAIAAVSFGGDL